MIIKQIVDPAEFFEKVLECKGSVELHTPEGDVLNLKSKLCQYIALTQIIDEGIIEAGDLRMSDMKDLEIIKKYLVFE